jgi:hypothetical protein
MVLSLSQPMQRELNSDNYDVSGTIPEGQILVRMPEELHCAYTLQL